jgi:hypothetical protein
MLPHAEIVATVAGQTLEAVLAGLREPYVID